MAQAKFEINRDLYKELSLADARLKTTIDLFEKKEMSSQERLFFKIWASPKLKIGVFDVGIEILKKGDVPLSAYAITMGSVECKDDEHEYIFRTWLKDLVEVKSYKDPSTREWGTDSLTSYVKKLTPGEFLKKINKKDKTS